MRKKQRGHVSRIPRARHTSGRQKWQLQEPRASVCLSVCLPRKTARGVGRLAQWPLRAVGKGCQGRAP